MRYRRIVGGGLGRWGWKRNLDDLAGRRRPATFPRTFSPDAVGDISASGNRHKSALFRRDRQSRRRETPVKSTWSSVGQVRRVSVPRGTVKFFNGCAKGFGFIRARRRGGNAMFLGVTGDTLLERSGFGILNEGDQVTFELELGDRFRKPGTAGGGRSGGDGHRRPIRPRCPALAARPAQLRRRWRSRLFRAPAGRCWWRRRFRARAGRAGSGVVKWFNTTKGFWLHPAPRRWRPMSSCAHLGRGEKAGPSRLRRAGFAVSYDLEQDRRTGKTSATWSSGSGQLGQRRSGFPEGPEVRCGGTSRPLRRAQEWVADDREAYHCNRRAERRGQDYGRAGSAARRAELLGAVNAVRSRGLSPFNVAGVAMLAGRIMIDRMRSPVRTGESFAFETTCSGKQHAVWLRVRTEEGWRITLHYLWLPTAEMAIASRRDA